MVAELSCNSTYGLNPLEIKPLIQLWVATLIIAALYAFACPARLIERSGLIEGYSKPINIGLPNCAWSGCTWLVRNASN